MTTNPFPLSLSDLETPGVNNEMILSHEEAAMVPPTPKRPRLETFPCASCSATYKDKRSLLRHHRESTTCGNAALRHPCAECGKTFTRQSSRARHVNEAHRKIPRVQVHSAATAIISAANFNIASTVSQIATESSVSRGEVDGLTAREETATQRAVLPSIIEGRSSSEASDSGIDIPDLDIDCSKSAQDDMQAAIAAVIAGTAELTLTSRQMQRSGISQRPKASPIICVFCRLSLESSSQQMQSHIGEHVQHLRDLHPESLYNCAECKVDFLELADLRHHQKSATEGNCGLQFDHAYECTGHHPPCDDAFLRDEDPMNFRKRLDSLNNWQHAQLQAFKLQVDDMIVMRDVCNDSDHWSIGAFRTNAGRFSLSTLQSSLIDQSAPDLERYQNSSRFSGRKGFRNVVVRSVRVGAIKGVIPRSKIVAADLARQLVRAASEGNATIVEQLLSDGVDVESRTTLNFNLVRLHNLTLDSVWVTPLAAAVLRGYHDLVELLLSHDAKVNSIAELLEGSHVTSLSVLQLAVNTGHLAIVHSLLARSAKTSGLGSYALSPLGIATLADNVEMARLLLEQGANADVSANHENELTAIDASSSTYILRDWIPPLGPRQVEGVEHAAESLPPMHHAVLNGSMEMVQLLVSHGAGVNGNRVNVPPVVEAALQGNAEMVRFLVESGADIHECGHTDRSALMYAAERVHNDAAYETALRILLNCGGDINFCPRQCNESGNDTLKCGNALIAAIQDHADSTVRILLANGANPHTRCHIHGNAAEVATKCGSHRVIPALLEYGVNGLKMWLATVALGHIKGIETLLKADLVDQCVQGEVVVAIKEQVATGHGLELLQTLVSVAAELPESTCGNGQHASGYRQDAFLVRLLCQFLDHGLHSTSNGCLIHPKAMRSVVSLIINADEEICAMAGVLDLAAALAKNTTQVHYERRHSDLAESRSSCCCVQAAYAILDDIRHAARDFAGHAVRNMLQHGPSLVNPLMRLSTTSKTIANVDIRQLLRDALHSERQDVVTLLLRYCLNPTLECLHGEPPHLCHNPLIAAATRHDTRGVQLLLEWGASAKSVCVYHGNALIAASGVRDREILCMLLENGAEPHLRTTIGSALDYVKALGWSEGMQTLHCHQIRHGLRA